MVCTSGSPVGFLPARIDYRSVGRIFLQTRALSGTGEPAWIDRRIATKRVPTDCRVRTARTFSRLRFPVSDAILCITAGCHSRDDTDTVHTDLVEQTDVDQSVISAHLYSGRPLGQDIYRYQLAISTVGGCSGRYVVGNIDPHDHMDTVVSSLSKDIELEIHEVERIRRQPVR